MVHHTHLILIASLVIGSLSGSLCGDLVAAEPGFETIFDGKSLQGWSGDPKLWSVQDDAITGVTTDEEPLEYNKFLIWDGEVENFHLRAKVRLIGNSNSVSLQASQGRRRIRRRRLPVRHSSQARK